MQQIEIDTGSSVLYLDAEMGKRGVIVTAYINNLSVRTSSIRIQNVRERWIRAVITACDLLPQDAHLEDGIVDQIRLALELPEFKL